mmetsp:Transcript_334/g.667  ORF Transcript_334/g.667 Transcript_334/m.667 type:complete len:83 (-) Transcript_334:106-354(-)
MRLDNVRLGESLLLLPSVISTDFLLPPPPPLDDAAAPDDLRQPQQFPILVPFVIYAGRGAAACRAEEREMMEVVSIVGQAKL